TLDGRFDLVSLHVYLVVRRLAACPPPGPDLAQGVFDAMFADMDVNLREMGVGDLGVSRRNRAMWEAFHGRAAAYQNALDAPDDVALAEALLRNVWRGAAPVVLDAPLRLAAAVRRCVSALNGQAIADLARGVVAFPAPQV
ncbi:MAG: ubiquinol-cytochrome C chaperone family protein, partial [Alphaproteobacteria bacterium]|nr:ubiquinol-cytochrome C chaperone family protein [Alphaproteobacteria bacterium]